MTDFIILTVGAVIILAAAAYIRREKKKGKRCVGCPHAGSCGGACGNS